MRQTQAWTNGRGLPTDGSQHLLRGFFVAEGLGEGQVAPNYMLMDHFGDTVSLWQFDGLVEAYRRKPHVVRAL